MNLEEQYPERVLQPLNKQWAEKQLKAATQTHALLHDDVKRHSTEVLSSGLLFYVLWGASLLTEGRVHTGLLLAALGMFGLSVAWHFIGLPKSRRHDQAKYEMQLYTLALQLGLGMAIELAIKQNDEKEGRTTNAS